MKRIAGTAALALVLWATPGAAQTDAGREIEDAVRASGVIEAVEELAAAVAPELERLADSFGRLAMRVASDPELRRTAVRTAVGAVEIAEVMVVEHAEILREALADAAEELGRMAEEMQ